MRIAVASVTLGTSREPRYGKIAESRNMSLYRWSKIGNIKEGIGGGPDG